MDRLTRLLHDRRELEQPTRFVKVMDRPTPLPSIELREMPKPKPDKDRLTGFWKRPVDNPRPKPRIAQPKVRERNGSLSGIGVVRAASFFRDAMKFAGRKRKPIKRGADVVLRDAMIRAGMIQPKVIKAAVISEQEQGTLSLVR